MQKLGGVQLLLEKSNLWGPFPHKLHGRRASCLSHCSQTTHPAEARRARIELPMSVHQEHQGRPAPRTVLPSSFLGRPRLVLAGAMTIPHIKNDLCRRDKGEAKFFKSKSDLKLRLFILIILFERFVHR